MMEKWKNKKELTDEEFIQFKLDLQTNNIHEVCFFCSKKCKVIYMYWSGQMRPDIFCSDYVPEDES